jgi:hypothetical protein
MNRPEIASLDMALQNRVDPFGEIHAVPARGLFTGNRGVIHDPDNRTLLKRRWTTPAWLICECDFRGRRREVMGRNAPSGRAGWTELFFLDEVTALAAGHRPCFYCRREKAREFAACFGEASGIARPRAADIDARLHRERPASGGIQVDLAHDDFDGLPEGAMIFQGRQCFAKRGGSWLAWDWSGYAGAPHCRDLAPDGARRLTPATTLAVLKAGYRPVWHPTAA